jgi:hypothetical protein
MELAHDLSRRDLLVLKEIRLTGHASDHEAVCRLLGEKLIAGVRGECFELTVKGRRMLVRGSPSLWNASA